MMDFFISTSGLNKLNSNLDTKNLPLSSTTLVCSLQQSTGRPIISTSTNGSMICEWKPQKSKIWISFYCSEPWRRCIFVRYLLTSPRSPSIESGGLGSCCPLMTFITSCFLGFAGSGSSLRGLKAPGIDFQRRAQFLEYMNNYLSLTIVQTIKQQKWFQAYLYTLGWVWAHSHCLHSPWIWLCLTASYGPLSGSLKPLWVKRETNFLFPHSDFLYFQLLFIYSWFYLTKLDS